MTETTKVGISVHDSLMLADPGQRRRILDLVSDAGLDYVCVGDHVSFHGGTGLDGLVAATSVLCTHDTLPVLVGVYLLGLRHPMLAARQLASISQLAPAASSSGWAWPARTAARSPTAAWTRPPAAGGWTRRWACCASWPPGRPSITPASSSASRRRASCPR